MSILRSAAADNTRKLIAGLTDVGIDLPEEVTAALARLDRVEARKPAHVDLGAVTEAYLDEVDDETLRERVVDHTTSQALLNAWSEAKIKAGQALRFAVTSNGDTLARQLQTLAAKPIAALEAAAELDTLDTAVLVRNRRTADAQLAANVELHAAELSTLYGLRHRVTQGASYGDISWGADCSRWRQPRKVDATIALTGDGPSYLRGIKAGAGLWFPLPAEAEALALPMIREAQEQAKAERNKGWGVGSIAR